QRRPVDAALDVELALAVHRAKPADPPFHDGSVTFARDTQIELRRCLRSDHVTPRPAADDSDVERGTALQVGQARDSLDLMCQFKNRALSLFEVEARMGRLP